jgi:hypothetical protein
MKAPSRPKRPESFAAGVGRALRQAAKTARKNSSDAWNADLHLGKIVAKKP